MLGSPDALQGSTVAYADCEPRRAQDLVTQVSYFTPPSSEDSSRVSC